LSTSLSNLQNQEIEYKDTEQTKIIYSSASTYYTNPFDDLCGPIIRCELKEVGCASSYVGRLIIIGSTG
jgi:hypothetical protein